MEPLTHALTGVALGRTGLKHWCPRGALVVTLAAITPDIDILANLWGAATYLHYHRHLTHSLVMLPLTALLPLLAASVGAWRQFRWGRAWALAMIGVASHVAIDWTNSYGVRPFLPFSERWFYLDLFSLYDLWLWAVLLVAAFAPLLGRLVSAEIGARPGSGRGLAICALVFFAGLGLWRWVHHERAVAVLESRLYQGEAPTRVAALPSRASPWLWRGIVETPSFYSIHNVDLRGEFDPAAGRVVYQPEPTPAEAAAWEAARQTRDFDIFRRFARFPLRRFSPLEEPEQGLRVEMSDLRFGEPRSGRFSVAVEVGADGRVLRSGFAFRSSRPR